jgi:WD40 repeat protein
MTVTSVARSNPYVGPRSFERGERLYGRQRELRELIRLLVAERIVLCHSPSGAGKTSLIQAALIPELEQKRFHVLPIIRINQEPPREDALPETTNRYLLSALRCIESAQPAGQQLSLSELASRPLTTYLQECVRSASTLADTVLIFDQFEEILTVDPINLPAKQAFFDQLGAALYDGRIWALFSIREDYVASLDPFLAPIPTRLKTTYRLPLLDKENALKALQEPARRAGVSFTDTAAEKLADDLSRVRVQGIDGTTELQSGPYIEPVQLQVVCFRLWEQLTTDATTITEENVIRLGNVDSALADYYDERIGTIAQATGIAERSIRDWFDRQLITEDGIRAQVRRGPVESGGLDNAAVKALVDTHLVRAERQRGATWYELAHDRLIEPIRASNTAWREAHFSTLQRQAAAWDAEGRSDGLLLQDATLVAAESWAVDHAGELTTVEQDFLETCQAARAALEHERQHARHIRRLAVGAGVVGIIAFISAVAALILYGTANRANVDATNARATAEIEAQHADTARVTADAARSSAQSEEQHAKQARATAEAERFRAEQNATELAHRAVIADGEAALSRGDIDQALALALASISASPDSPQARFLLAQAVDRSGTRQRFAGHTAAVWSVALSRDGKTALSTSRDLSIRLWDVTTGTEIRQFTGHRDGVLKAVFSPDERTILSSSEDRTLRLWDTATGQELRHYTGHSAAIVSAEFSPDGRTILSAANDTTIRLWDVDSGNEIGLFRGEEVATFSPDGSTILASAGDNTLRLWDVASGQEMRSFAGHTASIRSIAFSPDGLTAVSAGQDATIRLWDVASGLELRRFEGHGATVWSVAFSPDGRSILSGSADNTIRLWDAKSGQELRQFAGHTGSVFSVAFGRDGRTFLSGAEDQTVRLWDLENRQELRRLTGHSGEVYSLAITSDGTTLLSGSNDKTIRLWDVASGRELRRFNSPAPVLSVALSPDGKTAASGSTDSTVRLWDVNTGQEIGRFTGHSGKVEIVTFRPDGRAILSGSIDKTLLLWDIASGDELHRFTGHTAGLLSAVFSRDGRMILSSSEDGTVRVWDANSEQELQTVEGHSAVVIGVAFSPDEKMAISSSTDRTLRLWDLASGDELRRFTGHTSSIWGVAFSPDGETVLSGSADNTVRLWDVASGQELRRFLGHTARVWSVLYAPDGHTMFSSSSDGSIRLWQADTAAAQINWAKQNRFIPDLTCEQRTLYQVGPPCEQPEATATATP